MILDDNEATKMKLNGLLRHFCCEFKLGAGRAYGWMKAWGEGCLSTPISDALAMIRLLWVPGYRVIV